MQEAGSMPAIVEEGQQEAGGADWPKVVPEREYMVQTLMEDPREFLREEPQREKTSWDSEMHMRGPEIPVEVEESSVLALVDSVEKADDFQGSGESADLRAMAEGLPEKDLDTGEECPEEESRVLRIVEVEENKETLNPVSDSSLDTKCLESSIVPEDMDEVQSQRPESTSKVVVGEWSWAPEKGFLDHEAFPREGPMLPVAKWRIGGVCEGVGGIKRQISAEGEIAPRMADISFILIPQGSKESRRGNGKLIVEEMATDFRGKRITEDGKYGARMIDGKEVAEEVPRLYKKRKK